MLGLWSRDAIVPAPAAPGGSEIGLSRDTPADVDAMHAAWAEKGVTILQSPVDADFGRTFVAADPDGHHVRVFSRAA